MSRKKFTQKNLEWVRPHLNLFLTLLQKHSKLITHMPKNVKQRIVKINKVRTHLHNILRIITLTKSLQKCNKVNVCLFQVPST